MCRLLSGLCRGAAGNPRVPRLLPGTRGERSPWLPLETRPDSPGEPGMQPRDPCRPWRSFNEHPELISFTMDWLDLLAVQGTLKCLRQHHSSKAWILRRSAFFTVQLTHPYMTTGKTIALTRWTFLGKVMSLLFNMLSRLVITFFPRSKCLLISWLQSPSAVIL